MQYFIFGILVFYAAPTMGQEKAVLKFSLPETGLIPEGIAYYEKGNALFISSIHKKKIVKIDFETGNTQDFILSNEEQYQGGVGLQVDEKRGVLYALCFSQVEANYITGLHSYDLPNGNLKFKILLEDEEPKLLNDLALSPKGDIYITDTFRSSIYLLKSGTEELVQFYTEESLYPNGITIDPQGENLYIASWEKGVLRLNLESRQMESIHPDTVTSTGIDGLYFHQNGLIAIHNGDKDAKKHRIVRYHLNSENKVSRTEVIDQNNEYFDAPTTGVVIDNQFYIIANSQIPKLDQDSNQIKTGMEAGATFIFKYELH